MMKYLNIKSESEFNFFIFEDELHQLKVKILKVKFLFKETN